MWVQFLYMYEQSFHSGKGGAGSHKRGKQYGPRKIDSLNKIKVVAALKKMGHKIACVGAPTIWDIQNWMCGSLYNMGHKMEYMAASTIWDTLSLNKILTHNIECDSLNNKGRTTTVWHPDWTIPQYGLMGHVWQWQFQQGRNINVWSPFKSQTRLQSEEIPQHHCIQLHVSPLRPQFQTNCWISGWA